MYHCKNFIISVEIPKLYCGTKKSKNWLKYQDFTADFVKWCKIHEHGGRVFADPVTYISHMQIKLTVSHVLVVAIAMARL